MTSLSNSKPWPPIQEKLIINRLIDDILAKGWTISVNDGEETTLHYSTDKQAILAHMFTTEEDVLYLHDATTRKPKGFVYLLPSNGTDVISDCSSNPEMDDLINPILEYAGTFDA